MKTRFTFLAIITALVFSSCEQQVTENDNLILSVNKSVQDDLFLLNKPNVPGNAKGQSVLNFRAHLSGDQEVPQRETKARGEAVFQLSKDGLELSYKIIVANLDNISMAHIHVAPAGTNGPVVVWLYPPAPPAILKPGTTNGILQSGVIRKANLVGSLAGHELSDLVDLMANEGTYVNIHTSQFPAGEIRGQISGNVN
jgi:hypothetical protein